MALAFVEHTGGIHVLELLILVFLENVNVEVRQAVLVSLLDLTVMLLITCVGVRHLYLHAPFRVKHVFLGVVCVEVRVVVPD